MISAQQAKLNNYKNTKRKLLKTNAVVHVLVLTIEFRVTFPTKNGQL